ncbi:MAG: Gfo/Idh/MocA family oxidoreductase [Planctomycetota bacterium]|nr:MAG: Gfo/Idh/MocA family oxidoreductase [Planctomycetota bacterium]
MSYKCKKISRREFLNRSTKTAAGIVTATALASYSTSHAATDTKSCVIGANERINMAVIGIRGRGMELAKGFAKIPGVHVKTLCDVDENLFPERVKEIEQIQAAPPSTEYDLRRVFDDKDIDAVAIAAPNHWHALATIWACQAGKNVYVEKPSSHNIWEGRKMVEAARKYNRLVQVGFQNRSISNVRQAMKFLHDGKLGEIYMARGLCFKPRDSIGKCADGLGSGENYEHYIWGEKGICYDSNYMKGVHYDLWLGPAPERPFNYNRFHYNWHWNWDYGNGDIGNQGPHQFDVARWGINKNEHPVKVSSSGGYFAFDSDQQTPNTQAAVFEYADGKILQFEVRGVYTNGESAIASGQETKQQEDVKIGNLFYGTEGWMSINGTTWKTYFGRKNVPGPSSETAEPAADPMNLVGAGADAHFSNFIRALRAGKREYLTCDIEVGYMSTVLPHLANISYHLGRKLTFDGAREKFVGDEEADRMLTRKYREPYVVPRSI